MNPKETPLQASFREIKEETGLFCKMVRELSPLKLEKDGVNTYTHVFLAVTSAKKINLSDEHSAYLWMSTGEIDSLDKVIYKELLKQYLKEAEE